MYYVMHVCGCSDNQSQIELDYTFMARKMLLHMTQANDLKNASSVVACMYYVYVCIHVHTTGACNSCHLVHVQLTMGKTKHVITVCCSLSV